MKFKNLIFVTLRQLSDFKIGYIFNAMCAIYIHFHIIKTVVIIIIYYKLVINRG